MFGSANGNGYVSFGIASMQAKSGINLDLDFGTIHEVDMLRYKLGYRTTDEFLQKLINLALTNEDVQKLL
ncbi:hypothetical protein IT568_11050 [bacterium]|nr:hypothetical protein [bacterium]